MGEKIPLIYIEMHSRLSEKFGKREFRIKELMGILGKIYHLRKNFRPAILKDLIRFKLINRINRNRLSLIEPKIDVENTSKLYKQAGLYC